MRRSLATVILVVFSCALPCPSVQSGAPAAPSAVDLTALDRKADPCVDFYQFACGGWLTKTPLPQDHAAYGRFAELQERNFELLRRVLETPSSASGGDTKKASDFYAACMDERALEEKGMTSIDADLRMLGVLRNPDDLPVIVAHLHEIGVPALFVFGAQIDRDDATQQIATVDQGGLTLPDRDYYLNEDARSKELRAKYVAHVGKMFTIAGIPVDEAAADAATVLAIETSLARASLDRARRRDPAMTQHRMTLSEFQETTGGFDWRKYAGAAEAPRFQALNVSVPDYFRALNALVDSTTLEDLKTYLRWQVLHTAAPMLPRAFVEAEFDFFSRTLTGQQQPEPRWRRCVTATDRRLGEGLGRAFVERAFSETARSDARRMVVDIRNAMRQDIDAVAWMSAETRKAALKKLDAVADRIGHPESWRDYSSVRIVADDALGNEQRAIAFERHRELGKIGQPVDRSEWAMTPPTVNAYYSPDRNTINFPAGILQPPFYAATRDAAVNYGAAGAIVGHELTHGFDDRGRKFDSDGNLRNWWTPDDARAFEERTACLADQYGTYTVAGDTRVNGRLTLGENTADNGGLRIALLAYLNRSGAKIGEKIEGFTPEQRVFLGWAQMWCKSATPEAERLKAQTNPHAPSRYRVNGPASNMPEFAKAFSCRADAPMVRPNPCRVW
jgi:endothelin-converting enzyme/putative endopeptidase